jgi:hypothetical protein
MDRRYAREVLNGGNDMTRSNYSSAATAYGNQLARWRQKGVLVEDQKQLVPDIMIQERRKVDVISAIALGSVELVRSLPI